ncbi:MAG: M1 family metallopeptidase [Maribacter sp.]
MNRFLGLIFFLYTVFGFTQHQDKVDFTYADVYVKLLPQEKRIQGTVAYKFKVLNDVDSVFLDAKNMKFGFTSINEKVADFEYADDVLIFRHKFKKNETYSLGIGFETQPKQTVYFIASNYKGEIPVQPGPLGDGSDLAIEFEAVDQIWTQGQGKYTSHWLPSFDDMEEKVEFDLTLAVPNEMQVIANGKNIHTSRNTNGEITEWHFDMEQPMSSYLLAFAVGNYQKQAAMSTSGIPLENYYYPEDSVKVETTYRYTKRIFDFLEDEIGVPYPWQNYKQVPVRDFLYAGMENTGTTLFSDGYVIDSLAFVDKNYVNVNAHEMAHQWFGNLVTEKDGHHHWLHEGFATYYAYLAEKHLFGTDHFYWKLHTTLKQLQEQSGGGKGESLLDPKASSLTFYEKGAWALVALRAEVGDAAFTKGVKSYLKRYQFRNATVDDFLQEIKTASKKNLSNFKGVWLERTEFPLQQAKSLLISSSPSIKLWYDLQVAQTDAIDYLSYWDATTSVHFRTALLEKYHSSLPQAIYEQAFSSDTIPIRQALFSSPDLTKILGKDKLETLLEDESYITKELALFFLWQNYPEDREKYLNTTKTFHGLPNKNIRLLWLTLAMLSENFNGPMTKDYFDELSTYTDPSYGFELRQGAFFYLKEAFGLNEDALTNLVKATNHHAWQFKKFARNLLDELWEDADYKTRLQDLAPKLNPEDSRYLTSKLKTE